MIDRQLRPQIPSQPRTAGKGRTDLIPLRSASSLVAWPCAEGSLTDRGQKRESQSSCPFVLPGEAGARDGEQMAKVVAEGLEVGPLGDHRGLPAADEVGDGGFDLSWPCGFPISARTRNIRGGGPALHRGGNRCGDGGGCLQILRENGFREMACRGREVLHGMLQPRACNGGWRPGFGCKGLGDKVRRARHGREHRKKRDKACQSETLEGEGTKALRPTPRRRSGQGHEGRRAGLTRWNLCKSVQSVDQSSRSSAIEKARRRRVGGPGGRLLCGTGAISDRTR